MEWTFLAKKWLGMVLMPWPFWVTGVLVLTFLGLFSRGFRRLARLFAVVGFIALALLSMHPVSYHLWAEYERQYPPIDLQTLNADVSRVVVLGGGVYAVDESDETSMLGQSATSGRSALSRLSTASLARLVEGIRLLRQLPHAQLVLTGSGVFTEASNADLYFKAAQELGVASERMLKLAQPLDTESEAQAIKQLGDEPFLLVTSASHLPRAMRLMESQGLQPIAAPADYLLHPSTRDSLIWKFPGEGNLVVLKRFWHETLGMWWLDLKEWFYAPSGVSKQSAPKEPLSEPVTSKQSNGNGS